VTPWGIDSDSARILAEVLNGRAATRQDLVKRLGLRSTSVSALVGELLERQLLLETPTRLAVRGRPSLALVGNPHRVAVLVFHVMSQSLHATAVNLARQAVAGASEELSSECDNAAIASCIDRLRERVLAQMPAAMEPVAASFSLPGLVDTDQASWVFSSRWPRLRRLALRDTLRGWSKPVFVCRNLDAELSARVAQESAPPDRVLLLHWGYGIGAAFALRGKAVLGGAAGFGEIGHWRMAGASMLCLCGRTGCLETVSGLWAIGPELLGTRFSAAADESAAAAQLEELDLTSGPVAARALESMVLAVGNLCRVLFPNRVIVSGPFVAHRPLWQAFRAAFERDGLLLDLPVPELISDQRSRQLELSGAAEPALGAGLQQLGL